MNLVTHFTDLGNGILLADATELRNSGILPDPVARNGEVRLDQLPSVVWTVDEAAQTISFSAPDAALAPYEISARTGTALRSLNGDGEEAPAIDKSFGVVLNYALDFESATASGLAGTDTASGFFDARLFMPLGVLSHGFALAEDDTGMYRYRRLETYWRSAFPGRAVQVQIGDFTTRGPSWARPVRLGGVMIERNFSLRPDLVTMPLPSFEGSAAVPSVVEVYSNSIRTYATEIPAGPFALTDLPFATGVGEARIVVRDITGRETRVDLPFLVSSELLRPGMADYAFALGAPRLGMGTDADHYAESVFGAATFRYGVTNGLTVQGYAEAGEGLSMGGLGATFRLGTRGTSTLSYAHSKSDLGEGQLAELSGKLNFGRIQASGRFMRSWGTFSDIATLTTEPGGTNTLASPLVQLGQLSLSMPLTNETGAFASLFAASTGRADGSSDTSFGLSYSRPVMNGGTLNLTALSVRGQTSDTVLGLGLHLPLGSRSHMGTSFERRDGGGRQTVTASGSNRDRARGWDWRLQASHDDTTSLQANLGGNFAYGRVELGARISDYDRSIGLRLEGSVVAAGGGIFLTRRVNDAFAVIDAGAPGVEVKSENRTVGVTGRSGKLLVPDLRGYERNTLSIDPSSLPIDASVSSTRLTVSPAHRSGARVDFGVDANPASAVIELVDTKGQPLGVGGKAVVNGRDDGLLVGYDGQVFALALKAWNEITVTYPGSEPCHAEFAYTDEPGSMTEIRGVVCQ
ncbi:MAG: fimbria/pilus outer membrane usher protein [Pseudorhodobacter sp.]|nr:fimbria/pilus outer membrane usher protein [Pseudorhodobacter sp.]